MWDRAGVEQGQAVLVCGYRGRVPQASGQHTRRDCLWSGKECCEWVRAGLEQGQGGLVNWYRGRASSASDQQRVHMKGQGVAVNGAWQRQSRGRDCLGVCVQRGADIRQSTETGSACEGLQGREALKQSQHG